MKISKSKVRKYICDNCGIEFYWSEQSRWYGSYKQLEKKPNEIEHYCSDKCAKKGRAENLKTE